MSTTDQERAALLRSTITFTTSATRRRTSPVQKKALCQLLGCTERELMQAACILHNRNEVLTIDLGDTIAFSIKVVS